MKEELKNGKLNTKLQTNKWGIEKDWFKKKLGPHHTMFQACDIPHRYFWDDVCGGVQVWLYAFPIHAWGLSTFLLYWISQDLIFQLCSIIGHNKCIKVTLKKFPKIILFWAKWAILVQLWLKIIETYVSGTAPRIICKLCSMKGHNK